MKVQWSYIVCIVLFSNALQLSSYFKSVFIANIQETMCNIQALAMFIFTDKSGHRFLIKCVLIEECG